MARKVHVSVEVCVLVPIKVKADLFITADDDANIETAVKRFITGKEFTKGNLESVADLTVHEVNGQAIDERFAEQEMSEQVLEALSTEIESGNKTNKLLSMRVEDSR